MKKKIRKCSESVDNGKYLQKNYKKTVSFMIIFCSIGLSMLLCGCSSALTTSAGGLFDGRSNLNQGGYVTMNDDWIYYSNSADNFRLYKSHIDGTEKSRLTDYGGININVVDGWIYYNVDTNIADSSENGIFKIRTDGTDNKQIQAVEGYDSLSNVNIVDDWAYYFICDKDYVYSLNKTRTDGTEKTVLLKTLSHPENLSVSGSWIYYTDITGTETELCKIKTDGTNQTKLSNGGRIEYLNVSGDWIYYSGNGNDYNLHTYKIRTNGSEQSEITKGTAAYANVLGDWIYYLSYSSTDEKKISLNKICIDGSGQSKIADLGDVSDTGYLSVVGNWVYFLSWRNDSSALTLNKIHTDGTELTKIN